MDDGDVIFRVHAQPQEMTRASSGVSGPGQGSGGPHKVASGGSALDVVIATTRIRGGRGGTADPARRRRAEDLELPVSGPAGGRLRRRGCGGRRVGQPPRPPERLPTDLARPVDAGGGRGDG